jgi:hypothetical protein
MFEGVGVSNETVYIISRASSYVLPDDPHRRIMTAAIAMAKFNSRSKVTFVDEWNIKTIGPTTKPLAPPPQNTSYDLHAKIHASPIQTFIRR